MPMLMAAVDHPGVLPTHRVGRWRSQVAVERRLVYAPTLGEALPRGMRCDLPRALEILRPIAAALMWPTAQGSRTEICVLRLSC